MSLDTCTCWDCLARPDPACPVHNLWLPVPAEALQAEPAPDADSAAELIAMMQRDQRQATLVVSCVAGCLMIALIGLGWALRGWLG